MDKYIQYTPGDPCLDMACVGVCRNVVVMLYPGDELRRAALLRQYVLQQYQISGDGEVATLLPRPIMVILVTEDVDYKRI